MTTASDCSRVSLAGLTASEDFVPVVIAGDFVEAERFGGAVEILGGRKKDEEDEDLGEDFEEEDETEEEEEDLDEYEDEDFDDYDDEDDEDLFYEDEDEDDEM
jgi:hypothetical protein